MMYTLVDIEQEGLEEPAGQAYIIPGFLPAAPSYIYGENSVGKTGAVINICFSVAAGRPWAGIPVNAGGVIYIAGEDFRGVKSRLRAAFREFDLNPDAVPLVLLEPSDQGLISDKFTKVVESAAGFLASRFRVPVKLIVIDTLATCYGDESQDEARAATKVTGRINRLSDQFECAVLAIHHSGKSDKTQMRGSQVIPDRADAVIRVSKARNSSVGNLKVEKLRNEPDGASFSFRISSIDIPMLDGERSTQVVRDVRANVQAPHMDAADDGGGKRKDADVALEVLQRMLRDGAVTVAQWRDACFDIWPDKSSGGKRQAFSNLRKHLKSKGKIIDDDQFVSIPVSDFFTDVSADKTELSASASAPLSYKKGCTDARSHRSPSIEIPEPGSEPLRRGSASNRRTGTGG